jgi:hypothetical protein
MVKLQKKIVTCVLLAYFVSVAAVLDAGVQLRLKGGLQGREDGSDAVVTVMAEGDEYTLQVVCEGISEKAVVQGLDKIPHFALSRGGTSSSMTMINGKTKHTMTYTYALQPLEVGAYTIGPVVVDDEGHRVESNAIAVRVVTAAVYDQFAGKKGAARQALSCEMHLQEHEVYAGQPAVLTVTIQDDGHVHERGLQGPEFGSLQMQPIGKPFSEQKMVNGQVKVITTQQYSVTADKPGTYTIEPAVAHFLVPDDERESMGGFFGGFFGPSGKKRSIRSNSSILAVKPLPLSDEPVDAVGSITGVLLRVQKLILDLNEPCVLTYSVTGTCNFDAMTAPVLQVSDAISVYPSTTQYTPDTGAGTTGTKIFEYIIQIGEPGRHEIPAQRFVYFDVKAGEYRVALTQPCSVQVKEPKLSTASLSKTDATHEPDGARGGMQTESERELPVVPLLPWWVLVMSVLLGAFIVFYDMWAGLARSLLEMTGITGPVKREQQVLTGLIRGQAIEQVHPFFIGVIVRLWQCESQLIDGEYVSEMLKTQDVDAETAAACGAYIEACSQASFAPHMVKESVKTELLNKAEYWYGFFIRLPRKG